jgi:putative FmdB family regulatory protein
MPLYEYECETENKRFEVIQKFSDAPLTTCPTCGGVVRRLISSPAIQFKGSGWYITDYARKGSSSDSSSSSKSNGSNGGASTSSSNSSNESSSSKSSSSSDSSSSSSSGSSSSTSSSSTPSSSKAS